MPATDDDFANALVRHLDAKPLSEDVMRQLQQARHFAVGRRRLPRKAFHIAGGSIAWPVMQRPLWVPLALASLVLTVAVGLSASVPMQSGPDAATLAAIDAAILTDILPVHAYVDTGFAQYLEAQQHIAND